MRPASSAVSRGHAGVCVAALGTARWRRRRSARPGPGLLGQRHVQFLVNGDPTRPDFSIDTLTLPADQSPAQLRGRIGLQAALDRHGEHVARLPVAQAMSSHYERAYRLLQSPTARRAFDLTAEPVRMREHYGMHHFAQSCLLARRLMEAEVPMVTVYWNSPSLTTDQSWDTHVNQHDRMRDHLLPAFDRALTALLDDLHQRGLLDDTLVIWMGEFGRTPRINRNGGRDHWGFCQSVLMARAGCAAVRSTVAPTLRLPTPPNCRSVPMTWRRRYSPRWVCR